MRETYFVRVRRSRQHYFSAVQPAALQVILVNDQLVVGLIAAVDADNTNITNKAITSIKRSADVSLDFSHC